MEEREQAAPASAIAGSLERERARAEGREEEPDPEAAVERLEDQHRERRERRAVCVPKLKGSIGEVSNHSNFSHQSSVKVL